MTNPNDPWAQGANQGDQRWSDPRWSDPQGSTPYGQQPNPYQPGPQPTQQYGQPGQQPYQGGGQQYPHTRQYDQQYPSTQQYPHTQQYPPTQQYPQQGGWGGPPSGGGWGAPPPPGQDGGWGAQPPDGGQYGYVQAPPPNKHAGLLVGAIVVVVLLVAGAATAFFAFGGTGAGAPTPREAAVNLVNSLGNNDVLGLVDGLAPAEADVINDYVEDGLGELKRLEVVKPDTKADEITGIGLKAENLVFDDAAEEKVNDHLSITKLVDGTVTISSDWSKIPLTDKFVEKAFPDGKPSTAIETRTVDISDEIAARNGEPVRIATVKVDGEWYPSLFYTIADYALVDAGKAWPAQGIQGVGADSPEQAVRSSIEAALDTDVQRLIELTAPDEMSALHDVGPLLVDAVQGKGPSGASLVDLQTTVEDATGGKRVRLSRLAIEADGERVAFEVDGDCVKVEEGGHSEQLCGADLAQMVAETAKLKGSELTDEQLGAIERAAIGYVHSGVVAVEVDGEWFVSPARTFGDLSMGFLRKLEPGDLETLIALLNE